MDAEVRALIDLIPQLRGKRVSARALKGGLTNRNFRLDCEGERFVLRITGKNSGLLGINRHVECICSRAAHALGVGPEVIAFLPDHGALLTRFVQGRALTPEDLRNPAILRRVVASLRRYHEGANGEGRFSAFETVRRYYTLAGQRNVPFPRNITRALKLFARIEVETGTPDRVFGCHNDLLSSNLIDDQSAIWILDWEYAGAGDLFFDLGNLAANNLFNREQEKTLLQCYFGKTVPEDLLRLRLMRLVSDMREAMWGFLQIGISTLDFDYQTYARRHLRGFLKGAERL